jgi:hypothetical protein
MSLENIQLPDFLLADLYKDCLVELESLQEEKLKEPVKNVEKEEISIQPILKVPVKFLGQNKRNIVVVVDEGKALIINELELEFLTKILTACNLNLADIAIINSKKNQITLADLQEQFEPKHVLLLGVEPGSIKIPFSIPHFQVQPYGGCTFVYTPSLFGMLPTTQESRLLKSKLWLSLKTAFNL